MEQTLNVYSAGPDGANWKAASFRLGGLPDDEARQFESAVKAGLYESPVKVGLEEVHDLNSPSYKGLTPEHVLDFIHNVFPDKAF